jgi:hypothetical protein
VRAVGAQIRGYADIGCGFWHPLGVSERRPTNSELRLQQVEELEQEEREERGILELFDDADEPLDRDPNSPEDR